MRVTHLITGLDTGGAEMMLYKLLSHLHNAPAQSTVISLTDIGSVGAKIQAIGVPVRALGMRRGMPHPSSVLKLAGWLHQERPDVLQTWMYHADLLGGLAAKLTGGPPVAWNLRQSNFDPHYMKRTTVWVARTCARLSRTLPARIVCCSEVSRRLHIAHGYAAEAIVIIPNGFDLSAFVPNPSTRASVRQELCLAGEAPLIGLVGRFDPQKDHQNFIQAAALLHAWRPDVHFLLCGKGITIENATLAQWIEAVGLRAHCHLLGNRHDMPRLTAALDIATSSSYSEGFPNVIGEAMACGIPCVVTDAGDSALIVGTTGTVVPVKNPQALAEGWRALIEAGSEKRSALGAAARRRVAEQFNLPVIAAQYAALYEEMVTSCVA